MGKQAEIKELKAKIKGLQEFVGLCKQQISQHSKEMHTAEKDILSLQYDLNTLLKGEITVSVSDHALMRYCERVLGVDMEKVKQEILTESTMDLIDKLKAGDGQYPVKEGGFVIRLKNQTVVTII